MKVSNSGNEAGKTFVLERNGDQAVLGIQKGRLVFANYRFQIDGEEFILKDNAVNSLLYFCVDGTAFGKKLRIEENWDEEIEVKVDGRKAALMKPNTISLEATIVMDEEVAGDWMLFSLTCLMYFMFMIYKDETDIIESIFDGLEE
ncbi:hypothetical protein [Paenibacillus sp. CECT 9249]|uniref:hypothetical protein n=1 Tax=Paenibacillus sp. CECT 9249 TaxID=2845385 RepID=UPI001E2C624B|nr:hypothetical protein [Paenibacillus sp. CECT 9249]